MPLSPGTKFGPYEISSPLGAGGMGEVYRALDTRLHRTVAIKILPSHLSRHPEAKQRFEREARAISSLNHPNICTLYDIGQQNGIDFLVMEFLEGETLAERLRKGPLPPEPLLKCANEICEGLDKAHRTGVVHRDLKPANIMLTKTGAKLMDFGLAKSALSGPPPSSSLTMTVNDSAKSEPLTAQGTIVGTYQYMSPEQVEGKEADARSDIFALGAVFFEMATGKRAFEGKTTASVIAAVLAAEPQPITTIQPMSPPALDRVVKTCLAKDPDERFQNVHDVKLQLQWITEGGSKAGVPAPVAVRRKTRERTAWIVAALALLGALALAVIHFRQPASEVRVVRSTILPPENGSFVVLGPTGAPKISPDGRSVVFLARVASVNQLWVRSLDSFTPRVLPGTEDAYGAFWSPDSRNIGFFTQGKLKRVSATGGPALNICDADPARGGTWNRQDVILFAKYPGEVFRVSASGGTPQPVTKLDPSRHDTTHRWPYFLPDGNHFLYMASPVGSASDENVFFVGSLDAKAPDRLLMHATSPMAFDHGYLLYMVEKTVMARPFDPDKLEFLGDPIPVAEHVQFDSIYSNGVFSASNGGLLFQAGDSNSGRRVEVVDATGKTVRAIGSTAATFYARLSPDAKRVAYAVVDVNNGKSDIWVFDIASGVRTRLTIDPVRSNFPAWSRDNSKVAYASTRSGKYVVYVKPANGMGLEQKLWEAPLAAIPFDWTPDSKKVIVRDRNPATGKDRLLLISAEGQGEPVPVLEAVGANIVAARLSADARWVAYQSDESGKSEIYVSAFPNPVGKLQISSAGGTMPTWRADGRQLYYLDSTGMLTAVDLTESKGTLQVVQTHALFPIRIGTTNDTYDTFPDGKKFIVDNTITQETPAPLSLVQNWQAELKK